MDNFFNQIPRRSYGGCAPCLSSFCESILHSSRTNTSNKLVIHPSPRDGHCLLHSIKSCLSFTKKSVSLENLLHLIRTEFFANKLLYAAFCPDVNLVHQLNCYLDHRIYNSQFGDLVPLILANALHLTIRIYNGDLSNYRDILPRHSVNPHPLLVRLQHDHYDALTINQSAQVSATLSCSQKDPLPPSRNTQKHFSLRSHSDQSDCVNRADRFSASLNSNPLSSAPDKKSQRKRGGKRRKRRAGVRRNQWKCERLGRSHLRILHWNCGSIYQRGAILENIIYSADITCLQETRLGHSYTFKPAGYNTIYNRSHHGQAIVIRNDINYWEVTITNTISDKIQFLAIEIIGHKIQYVVNVYARNNALKAEDWAILEDIHQRLNGKTIFCGDFNARGYLWGNTVLNDQGTALEAALDSSDLLVANNGQMTRFATRPGDSNSAIDLSLISTSAAPLCQWNVLGNFGSDHAPCLIYIKRDNFTKVMKAKPAFRYSIKDGTVISHIRRSCYFTKPSKRTLFHQPPWWNQEMQYLWMNKRQALLSLQKCLSRNSNCKLDLVDSLKSKAKMQANIFIAAAKIRKKECYERFITEISADKALTKFWKFHRSMKNQHRNASLPNFVDENGTNLTSDKEKGEALLQRFLAQTDQKNALDRKNRLDHLRQSYQPDDSHANLNFSSNDLINILNHSTDSTPGPDRVKYSHLKALSTDLLETLAKSMNDSLKNGFIPDDWLHSALSPIPKPDKDHGHISGFRIITMQNTVGKVLEKYVARNLMLELERKSLLPNTLGSYRPGKDTWANAAVLAADVYRAFEEKKETLATALDLEDAYNRVQFNILMDILTQMNISKPIVVWIGAALLNRDVYLRVGTWSSDPHCITPGLPQGSPLSPICFNVYTAAITANQLRGPGRTLSFADDVLVYRSGKDRKSIAESLQQELDRINDWCSKTNSKIHPGKASSLWFSLNNRAINDNLPSVSIGGKDIGRVQCFKYLGISFDRCLSFKEHVNHIVKKARKGLSALKCIAGAKMPQRIIALAYRSLVLPIIEYGLGLLTLSPTQVKRLDVIQNEAMRIILGCTRCTSTQAMRYYLNLPNMTNRKKLAQVKALMRVFSDVNHPIHKDSNSFTSHHNRLKRGTSWTLQAATTISEFCDIKSIHKGPAWISISTVKLSIKVLATLGRHCREWMANATETEVRSLIINNSKSKDAVIYTDGSVQHRIKSGWAFSARVQGRIIHEDSGATKLTTSSMVMEIQAISRALEWVATTAHKHVVIVTDSMSTLDKIRHGLFYHAWLNSIKASKLKKITFIFSPGHAGVKGNERADHLAGKAPVGTNFDLDCLTTTSLARKHLGAQLDDTMESKGIRSGEGNSKNIYGRSRMFANQLLFGTISKATLKWTLKRRAEQVWVNPDCDDAVSAIK